MNNSTIQKTLTGICMTALLSTGVMAQHPKLSKHEAQMIALKLHPGKVKSAELEKENGVRMYSFDISTKEGTREVGIDADSGKVIEDKIESKSDEAKEKAAEKAKKL